MDDVVARFFAKTKRADVDAPYGLPVRCLLWTAHVNTEGYGTFRFDGNVCGAHRVAFFIEHGRWPEPCGLHRCDVRHCCESTHIYEGTDQDNTDDKMARGRHVASPGDKNGQRLHPERVARGDRHSSRTHPELVARGERHGSVTHPECVARGDRSGSRLHPERLARGERHGSVTHPECLERGMDHWSFRLPEKITRGEKCGNSKLTEEDVRAIRASTDLQTVICMKFGISRATVLQITSRRTWKHVK